MSKKRILLAIGGGLTALLIVAFATGTLSFRFHVSSHSPELAAEVGEEFASIAFVQGDGAGSLDLLSEDLADEFSIDEIDAAIAAMHPDGKPDVVKAVEFERLNGYGGMGIYLEGTAGDRTYYYRLLMDGSSFSGYSVSGFWRAPSPYPNPQAREQLR